MRAREVGSLVGWLVRGSVQWADCLLPTLKELDPRWGNWGSRPDAGIAASAVRRRRHGRPLCGAGGDQVPGPAHPGDRRADDVDAAGTDHPASPSLDDEEEEAGRCRIHQQGEGEGGRRCYEYTYTY